MTVITYAERAVCYPEGSRLAFVFQDNDTVEVFTIRERQHTSVPGAEIGDLCTIEFQAGPIPEYGVNGLTNEILIDILVERIGLLNKMFPCRENSLAIANLEGAKHWLDARTARRVSQGIEGKHEERA